MRYPKRTGYKKLALYNPKLSEVEIPFLLLLDHCIALNSD